MVLTRQQRRQSCVNSVLGVSSVAQHLIRFSGEHLQTFLLISKLFWKEFSDSRETQALWLIQSHQNLSVAQALRKRDLHLIQVLADKGVALEPFNLRILQLSVELQDLGWVDHAVQLGADPHKVLQSAAAAGHAPTVACLLAHCRDPRPAPAVAVPAPAPAAAAAVLPPPDDSDYEDAVMSDESDESLDEAVPLREALHVACRHGHVEVVQQLLAAGASPTFKWALFGACEGGHLPVVQLLAERGADVHVDREDPLSFACQGGQLEVAMWLLEAHGADVAADGQKPLLMTCWGGCLELLEALLARGATLQEENSDVGGRAARHAASRGHLPLLKFLRSRGVAMDVHTLWTAFDSGHRAICDWLLTEGGVDGTAALPIAVETVGYHCLARWLASECGCSVGEQYVVDTCRTGSQSAVHAVLYAGLPVEGALRQLLAERSVVSVAVLVSLDAGQNASLADWRDTVWDQLMEPLLERRELQQAVSVANVLTRHLLAELADSYELMAPDAGACIVRAAAKARRQHRAEQVAQFLTRLWQALVPACMLGGCARLVMECKYPVLWPWQPDGQMVLQKVAGTLLRRRGFATVHGFVLGLEGAVMGSWSKLLPGVLVGAGGEGGLAAVAGNVYQFYTGRAMLELVYRAVNASGFLATSHREMYDTMSRASAVATARLWVMYLTECQACGVTWAEAVEQLAAAAGDDSSVYMRDGMWHQVAVTLLGLGHQALALSCIERIPAEHCEVRHAVLVDMCEQLLKGGQVAAAAEAALRLPPGHHLTVATWAAISEASINAGDLVAARQYLERLPPGFTVRRLQRLMSLRRRKQPHGK